MIVLGFLVIGALIGGSKARRRGGNRLDIAQYAAVYAIAFALLGMILTIAIDRSLS
ncbi:apolipoprotein acyltransferase [Frigidibacter sp. ROC022]|uniref:apolipoprotein acyltransferase n=1 Tax=Frigidibacter sp. ROC022 TaxID=2971796 RepID=UPI00215AFCD1|nr:apolipoprotein acyltransferase [Frigidibacter sp. ROC022]MCR8726411.1 apolipoprotein acyltransferase [Frigidibacter sp. ROC022]